MRVSGDFDGSLSRGEDLAPALSVRRGGVWAAALAAGVSFLALYWSVMVRLYADWLHDDNYSHGFLIVPLACYFAWERRASLARAVPQPSLAGAFAVVAGLALLVAGLLGAELFLTRVSLVVVIAGATLFLFGWRVLSLVGFPIAFLLLMIPIPAIIFNQVAFPLQLFASKVGEVSLAAAGVPVLREGNVIVLANTTLEVAEACSGIRSLISLITLALVYGYFSDPRFSVRAAITVAAIPIAILTNGARVAGTGIAAHFIGPEAAEGFFHTFSGWIIFVVAFVLMFGVMKLLLWLFPPTAPPQAAPVPA